MGLYYVNDNLITEELFSEGNWPQNNEDYKRFMIKTAPGAMKKNDDGNFEEIARPICAYNCSTLANVKTRISSTVTEAGRMPRITVRASSDTKYDSDIFVVALPYEGLVKPFTHDVNALQIFKSLILKSDRVSIEHEDKKYKRVVYFVVRPHHNWLNEDGWYDEAANLVVTFAQSNNVRRDQEPDDTATWTFKTATVRFGESGRFEITMSEETVPYTSFSTEDLHSVAICTLVDPVVIDVNQNNGNRSTNTSGNAPSAGNFKRRGK